MTKVEEIVKKTRRIWKAYFDGEIDSASKAEDLITEAIEALIIQRVSNRREQLIDFAETYQNCHIDDTAENTVDWYLCTKDN